MKGFFAASTLRSKRPSLVSTTPKCGMCGLKRKCKTPNMPVHGEGKKGILIVGPWPSEHDDQVGKPFQGKQGKFLRDLMRKRGYDLFKDCWVTFGVRCWPAQKGIDFKQSGFCCLPNLLSTIKEKQPKLIILLGETSFRALLENLFKDNSGWGTRFRGLLMPNIALNTWLAPLDDIRWVMGAKEKQPAHYRYFRKRFFAALQKKKQPFDEDPKYLDRVQVIQNPAKAAKVIRRMNEKGGAFSFDYEGNCLKPEIKGAKILSCSICWKGKKTISYPMRNEALDATLDILRSRAPKIAANIKFEHRWTRAMYNIRIRNWWWDTMLAAHAIDNRPGITSLKFQAFAVLGAPSYDDHIKPFLSTKGKMRINRIDEIDERDLLLYGGLDSLYEYELAMIQMAILERRSDAQN